MVKCQRLRISRMWTSMDGSRVMENSAHSVITDQTYGAPMIRREKASSERVACHQSILEETLLVSISEDTSCNGENARKTHMSSLGHRCGVLGANGW